MLAVDDTVKHLELEASMGTCESIPLLDGRRLVVSVFLLGISRAQVRECCR